MIKGLEFSYAIDEDENTIDFYYIIRKSMGTKIKIKLPNYIVNTSQILANLIPYFGKEIEDFDTVCLNLLDNLPGNLHMYPEIVIIYDKSDKDVLGKVDLNNLDNYKGDVFIMHNGILDIYSDSQHRIDIRSVENEGNKLDYAANIVRSGSYCDYIDSLYECDSNSPYILFGKKFISELDDIRTKKVRKDKKRVKTKKDA